MISVIVAVYNAEKYLRKCVESILQQSYRDIEVLLINDGSTDRSLEICREFEQQDARVRVFSQENKGPAAARNVGLREMRGDYCTTLDSDDWLELNAYENVMKKIEAYKVDMVLFGYRHSDGKEYWDMPESKLRNGVYEKKECHKLGLDFIFRKGNKICPFVCARVMRCKTIRENQLQFREELKRSEDFLFLAQLHQKIDKLYVMDEEKYLNYRDNKTSITHSYVKGYWKMVKILYQELLGEALENRNILMQQKISLMLIYRAGIAIKNELKSKNTFRIKYRNLKEIVNDADLKKELSQQDNKQLKNTFGKRVLALKLKNVIVTMLLYR